MSAAPEHKVDSRSVGFSVYAHVDQATLDVLNRCADEQQLPRSWLISRILHQWAAQQAQPETPSIAA